MKKHLLLAIGILFSFGGFAQSAPKDSLLQWQISRTKLSAHIDSLRKLADDCDRNLIDFFKKTEESQADLDAETQRGKQIGKADQPKMDSLNARFRFFTELKNDEQFFFDKVLVRLDSCLGVKNELDRKIGLAQHK
jgi:hypothetical protein